MESPAKRRRIDRSWESDEGDDLSFQPQEASDRRDPGHQLEVERANADNRFQSAMAHIFEKYGRDFEGVGDEIDMMTGEIVVNNGHLKNMRNEADVGTGMVPGEDEEEVDGDEGGLRWEDLLDEDQFESSSHDSSGEDDEETNYTGENGILGENNEQDEEDRSLHGQRPSSDSTTAPVPLNSGMAQAPLLQTLAQGSFGDMSHHGPPGMLFGGPGQDFGASPLGFGASPLAFGHSPLAFNPWTQHLPQQSMWDGPEIPQHQAMANRVALQPRQKRQSVSSAPTGTSIWTSGTSYEYQLRRRSALGQRRQSRSVVAKKPRPKKHPLSRGSQLSTDTQHDGDDEERPMPGKRSSLARKNRSAEPEVQDSDEEGSLPSPPRRQPLTESKSYGNDKSPENNPPRVRKKPGPKPGTPRPAGSKKPGPQPGFRRFKDGNSPRPKPGSRRRKLRVNDRAFFAQLPRRDKSTVSDRPRANGHPLTGEAAETEVNMGDREDTTDRRRSGRERKPVEQFSQVIWPPGRRDKARPAGFAERRAARGAAGLDISSDEDEQPGSGPPKPEGDLPKSPNIDTQVAQNRVVPDSQDTITPPTSSIPEVKQDETSRHDVVEPTRQEDADPSSLLSDDEMPMRVLPQSTSLHSDSYTTQVFSLIRPADAGQAGQRLQPGQQRRHSISGYVDATSNENTESTSRPESRPGLQTWVGQRRPDPPKKRLGMPKRKIGMARVNKRMQMRRQLARSSESHLTNTQLDEGLAEHALEGTAGHVPVEHHERKSPDWKETGDADVDVKVSSLVDGLDTHASPAHGIDIARDCQDVIMTPGHEVKALVLMEDKLATSENITGLEKEVLDSQGDLEKTMACAGEGTAPVAQASPKIVQEGGPDPEPVEPTTTSIDSATNESAPVADGDASLPQEQISLDTAAGPAVESGTLIVEIRAVANRKPSTPEVTEASGPEAQPLPVEPSPVVEETDHEPSSAPERFGSPELGSPVADPFDLPPSPTAPPRFSPAKTSVTSPVKPSPLRKAHIPQSAKASSPSARKSASPTKLTSPSKITKASTPTTPTSHHISPRKSRTPSSRRSLLSLTRRKADDEDDFDELGAAEAPSSAIASASNRRTSVSRKIWKATPRTTEVSLRSPERRQSVKVAGDELPGDVTRTPGGTMRTCGVDGFQCGRDFCFTCL